MKRPLRHVFAQPRCAPALTEIALICCCWITATAQDNVYRDIRIPSGAAFSFPTATTTLNEIRNRQDVPSMRSHAWSIFTGIIQPSTPGHPDSVPIWETWYTRSEDLPNGCLHQLPSVAPGLEIPAEIKAAFHSRAGDRTDSPEFSKVLKQAVDFIKSNQSPRSGILYNQAACDHIRSLGLQSYSVLWNALQLLDQVSSPSQERDISPFPNTSIVVKAVWEPVYLDTQEPSVLRIWNGQSLEDVEVRPAKKAEPCKLQTRPLPTSCFYAVAVTDDNVDQINSSNWPTLTPGCAIVLIGLHVITKEVTDWSWSTFWFSLSPNDPPFGADRPNKKLIPSPWNHYLMDMTFSMVTPWQQNPTLGSGTDSVCTTQLFPKAKLCFNPYIEDPITQSNCMHCHIQATFPRIDPSLAGTSLRGYIGPDNACFQDRVRVDYLWSLSQNKSDTPLSEFEKQLQELLTVKRK